MNSPSSAFTTPQPLRMWRFSDSDLYCVAMKILRSPELMQLDSVKSTIRYGPPNMTDGLAWSRVSGESRSPAPPARSTATASRSSNAPPALDGGAELLPPRMGRVARLAPLSRGKNTVGVEQPEDQEGAARRPECRTSGPDPFTLVSPLSITPPIWRAAKFADSRRKRESPRRADRGRARALTDRCRSGHTQPCSSGPAAARTNRAARRTAGERSIGPGSPR